MPAAAPTSSFLTTLLRWRVLAPVAACSTAFFVCHMWGQPVQSSFWPVLALLAWSFAVLNEWQTLKKSDHHRLAASLAFFTFSLAVAIAIPNLPVAMLYSALPVAMIASLQWFLSIARRSTRMIRIGVTLLILTATAFLLFLPGEFPPLIRYTLLAVIAISFLSSYNSTGTIDIGETPLAAARSLAFTLAALIPLITWSSDGIITEFFRWENLALFLLTHYASLLTVRTRSAAENVMTFSQIGLFSILMAGLAGIVGWLIMDGQAQWVMWSMAAALLILAIGAMASRNRSTPEWLRLSLPDLPFLFLGVLAFI